MYPLLLGIDIGSTTVKAALTSAANARPVRTSYRRHHGLANPATECLLGTLAPDDTLVVPTFTGSGGKVLARQLGLPSVHEVTALAAAVRATVPRARTVFELGGQDAKILRIEAGASPNAPPRVDASMNDRCAAGTGVTIDRILARLGVTPDEAARIRYLPRGTQCLSTKCGVFAETDAVNLARAGVSVAEIVSSLADAIVRANLAVLARGAPLAPVFLVLGGPVQFLPALAEAFRHHLGGDGAQDDVLVPREAVYFAAVGATLALAETEISTRRAMPLGELRAAIAKSSDAVMVRADKPLATGPDDVQDFRARVAACTPAWRPRTETNGIAVGIDAGSTVCKAVALDVEGTPIVRLQRASRDPVADGRALIEAIDTAVRAHDPSARIDRIGVTGYGAELLAPVLGSCTKVLETVAHAASARVVAPDADVVCDVGGLDIKILSLESDGSIRDFRMSSQCAAGIGAVLEAVARELNVPLERYADVAFDAPRAPTFSENCVVFLDADRTGFQRMGCSHGEILAGLARALARVVWNHVAHDGAILQRGRTVILQGGVQRNLAALRAQFDLLSDRVPDVRIRVHPYPEFAGALGAALLARRDPLVPLQDLRRATSHSVVVRRDASTRCTACHNGCARTEVTIVSTNPIDGPLATEAPEQGRSASSERIMVGNACDVGSSLQTPTHTSHAKVRARWAAVPNLLADEARWLFARTIDTPPLRAMPRSVRVGIPRVLSMYRSAPFYRAYLQALGVAPRNVVFSPPSSDDLWRDGARGGATDPCYPAKVTHAHVRYLLERVHDRGVPLDALVTPQCPHAAVPVTDTLDCASCPVVEASGALVRATFGACDGALAQRRIALIDDAINLTEPEILRAQMHASFSALTGATRDESDQAVQAGVRAMQALDKRLRARAQGVLDTLSDASGRGAVLVIARPYHADPGISHRVGEELQALGYPTLTIRSLPRDPGQIAHWLRGSTRRGPAPDPWDIRDLLPESDNSGTTERLWAARLAAGHGRLGVVDLSSFKCAQDPPSFAPMRALFEDAGTVRCTLHDLDETRPIASLRLRLKTFAHAMQARGLAPW